MLQCIIKTAEQDPAWRPTEGQREFIERIVKDALYDRIDAALNPILGYCDFRTLYEKYKPL